MKKSEILQAALDRWGAEAQCMMAIEECSELIQALSHKWRGRGSVESVVEEIADVTLMVEQMALIFGKEDVDRIMSIKLQRLKGRIEDSTREIIA